MKFVVSLAILSAGASALAQFANFDDKSEGFFNSTLVDGGITFANNDQYLGDGPHDNFTIDDASGSLSGSYFSSPNVMGFGGWANGDTVAYDRIGSFTFGDFTENSSASLELFYFQEAVGNTLTMNALRNGTVVGSTTVHLDTLFQPTHVTLAFSGAEFDSVDIVAAGPNDDGAVFGVVDNVRMTPVPEPATIAALSVGAFAILRRRRR